jgi:hypothetical protein
MFTNKVAGPRPVTKVFVPRQLPARKVWCAPVFDTTLNNRINNRSYKVELVWDAMLMTPPYAGERKTFPRWSRVGEVKE